MTKSNKWIAWATAKSKHSEFFLALVLLTVCATTFFLHDPVANWLIDTARGKGVYFDPDTVNKLLSVLPFITFTPGLVMLGVFMRVFKVIAAVVLLGMTWAWCQPNAVLGLAHLLSAWFFTACAISITWEQYLDRVYLHH